MPLTVPYPLEKETAMMPLSPSYPLFSSQTVNIPRILTSAVLAASVTFGLFLAMNSLISVEFKKPVIEKTPPIEISTIRTPEKVTQKITPPVRPKETETLTQRKAPTENTEKGGVPTDFTPPETPPFTPKKLTLTQPEGDMQPLTAFAPAYPNSLSQRGIEGYVIVQFEVSKIGKVENAWITESSHKGFHKSALRAIKRFKYKPKVKDGQPIRTTNAFYRFTYSLKK